MKKAAVTLFTLLGPPWVQQGEFHDEQVPGIVDGMRRAVYTKDSSTCILEVGCAP